ncbi:ParB/RepB/Spo0J family partition protein [Acidocella sp. KAb 2-4]|uniref:ParB/RepB/Spo0J family partition protein n=1 Tax=Acidocella sp. KAb 2-4 TaxID=2885158 RepID=UPI001D08E0E9|nr:ParB/RepB/Spo0J family partition protein [Acidocella sp. KAb 2-4]MCB5945127.1 ParB/RepB/Spo0J family partition protein [Acidocella sp. KAb 2-4]MDD2704169.1 ParB/RepB/Spo0J family partition protein [Acidocella sp.]
MAKTVQKITLSASRDIPFDRLVLSQSNVRRIKAGVSIEELAADIARRTLLQSITVRPVLDEAGAETGMFEIPAGGRRYRALELLVKQKRLAKTAPIPCVVRTEGIAEEDSLAENVQRAPLHPLDQFRAFQALREKGQSEEEIAAVFFVAVSVVKQRLRLAAVSPRLLEVYAEDEMNLDQLMAFSVSPDHERQEQVWEALQRSYNKEPYQIRRMLTEGAVRASDKRAQYAGEDYIAAGGPIMRDLFQQDDGGWLQDAGLLVRVVAEKLERDGDALRAEGWKWVEMAPEFPYGHSYGLRRIPGTRRPLTDEEIAQVEALRVEAEQLEEEAAVADEVSDDADARLAEIEAEIDALTQRPPVYDPAEIAMAGVFVSIDGSGALRVERGYVRPEDEPVVVEEADEVDLASEGSGIANDDSDPAMLESRIIVAHVGDAADPEPEEEDGIKPLPDRLLTELTAYRTLALREALGHEPGIAYLALLHALCLRLFYRYGAESCLEIEAKSVMFGAQAQGLADTPLAARVDARHEAWAAQLPEDTSELWEVLAAFDSDSREALFAHCVALTLNATHDAYNRRPRALAHAGRLAETMTLDLVAAGWVPTAENYFGRVTKARILEAVREAKGEQAAQRLEGLKKDAMAEAAAQALAGSGWLPEALRTKGVETMTMWADSVAEATHCAVAADASADVADEVVEAADLPSAEDEAQIEPHEIAAE